MNPVKYNSSLPTTDDLAEISQLQASTDPHAGDVAELSMQIAQKLGLNQSLCQLLKEAAVYHDIGKFGIPSNLLTLPRPLELHEFEIVKQHTILGAMVLKRSNTQIMQAASQIALSHHEHWDGSGYPHGLQGKNIPYFARIVAVADVFDALINERPYKAAWDVSTAIGYITNQAGQHFDPEIVQAFLRLF
jgi:putative nucleotidyltransferase with HDIG domain